MMNTILNRKVLLSGGTINYNKIIDDFIAAASITDGTQISALVYLVNNLGANKLFEKMQVLYPFIGGNATSHSFNLIDTTKFQLIFFNSPTHSSNGTQFNGTSQYANTSFTPSVHQAGEKDMHFSLYSRLNNLSANAAYGTYEGVQKNIRHVLRNGGNANSDFYYGNTAVPSSFVADNVGLFTGSVGVTGAVYKRNVMLGSGAVEGARPAYPYFLGCINNVGTPANFCAKNWAFASIGKSFISSEVTTLYSIVQQYQTLLNRQV